MGKTGVYKVTCGDCGAFYVGQTGHSLDQRISEHPDAFHKEEFHKSLLARHLKDAAHDPKRRTTILLNQVPKGTVLNRL